MNKMLETTTPELANLADLIHKKLCHWNHTDYCGYEYSSWDDPNAEKVGYLEKAKRMVSVVGIENARKVFEVL